MNKILWMETLLGRVYAAECSGVQPLNWTYTLDINRAKAFDPEECAQFRQQCAKRGILVYSMNPSLRTTIQE